MSTALRFSFALSSPTTVLFVINVAVYGLMLLTGGREELSGPSTNTLMLFGADYAPLVFAGQVHRLIASAFLHINVWHLLMNSVALVTIGPQGEALFGRGRFVGIYLASGLGGSLASVAFHFRDPIVSAGASGALCGAIAGVAVAAFRQGSSGRPQLSMMLLWLGGTLVFGVLIGADNAAHLGGMLFGAAVAYFLRAKAEDVVDGIAASAVVVTVAVLAFGGAIFFQKDSRTAAGLVNHGVDLARAGDDEGAAAAYQRAIDLEPDSAIAHYDLGLALLRMEQYAKAIEHFTRALELDPKHEHKAVLVGAHINHGVSLARAGNHKQAAAAYRAAIALDDKEPRAHYNLGLVLEAMGDRKGAIEALKTAAKLDASELHKEGLADALAREGAGLMGEKKYAAAAKLFASAEKHDPSNADHPLYLGLSLMHDKRLDQAVSALKRAVRLSDDQSTREALASALEKRQAARTDKGNISGALDDAFEETVLGIAPPGSGLPGKPK